MFDRPISWGELITIVLFVLGAALLFYLIMAASNLIRVLRNVNRILEKNKSNIDNTIEKLPRISDNAEKITDSLKNNMEAIDNVVKDVGRISQTVKKGVETVQKDIIVKAKIIVDIIEAIKRFFEKKKDNPPKKKGTVYTYKYKKDQEKPEEVEISSNEIIEDDPYAGYGKEAVPEKAETRSGDVKDTGKE